MPIPSIADMFGDAQSPMERAERFEGYKAALDKSAQHPIPNQGVPSLEGAPVNELAVLQKSLSSPEAMKALSPELIESVRTSLAGIDVGKDINAGVSGALSGTGGLQAYDLEAPAKLLVPKPCPLRNRIARRKGVGLAHQFKTITGMTGSDTGGVALMRPGISESTQTAFGGVNYLRGPKISYAGTQTTVPYIQFGASDQVSWAAQFSGQGYQDIRQFSQTSVLWASMLLEERLLLGGRGTAGSFAGALAAPTAPTAPIAVVGATGYAPITGYTTNIYVRATSESVWGESVASSATVVTAAAGSYISLTSASVPQGATGIRYYVGTGASDPGIAASRFVARASNGVTAVIIQGALPTTGAVPPAADNSATALEYDGLLTYCTGANSGYVKQLNNTFAGADGANVGNTFNNAFSSLYDSVKAEPQEILAHGSDRKQVSDQLKGVTSNSYRITVDSATDAHNAQIGALVTGVQNEIVGDMVNISVHPWLPQGNLPIVSWTLPMADSNISDVFAVYNVQDMMAIQWPVSQFAYETSTYWYGTAVCYAPSYCGAITGVSYA